MQKSQCLVRKRSELLTGNYRIEAHDPEVTAPVDLVDRFRRRRPTEKVTTELGMDVMVAGHIRRRLPQLALPRCP